MIYVTVEKYGKNLIHIYLDENYKKVKKTVNFEPTVYECVAEKTNFKDIQGHYFNPVKTESIKKYEEDWRDTTNHYYLTTLPEKYQFISEMYPDDIKFDGNKMPRMFFDIEVSSKYGFPDPELAKEEILSIAMHMPHVNKTVVLGNKPDYIPTENTIEYFYISEEKDIIRRFFDIIHQYDVCFLLGWNSSGFDIPYIIKRGEVLGMDMNKILPLGYYRDSFNNVTKQKTIEIPGLIHYDYMLLFKKFWDEKFESYSLDFIANYFLGEGKVDYADHATLQNLYENDYQKFIEYNIKDAVLIYDIDKQKQLFNLVVELAYMSKINLSDIYGSMKIWDGLIYNTLIKQGILIPNAPTEEELEKTKETDDEQFVGAWVKDPERGMHEWVTSFDVGCVDTETEMLTNSGWKKHDTIDKNDLMLTFNINNKKLEYKQIKNIYNSKYNGEMIHIQNNTDQLLTPNHRVLFQERERYIKPFCWKELKFERADSLKSYIKLPMHSNGYDTNELDISDDMIKLCGWFLTEGSINYNTFSIYQSESHNPKYCIEIETILNNLKIKYTKMNRVRNNKNELQFYISAKDGKVILSKYLYNGKLLTKELLNMSNRQSNILLNVIIKGDGSFYKNSTVIITNNKKFSDQLCELSIKCGYKTTVDIQVDTRLEKNQTIYYVFSSKKDFTLNSKDKQIKKEYYNGIVWCVETENQTIICRRNGKVFITGNSMYPNNMISYNMSCLTIIPDDKLPEEIFKIKKDISVENLMNKKYDMSILKKYNVSMAANGAVFDISKQDLLTQILEKIYFERKKIQKQAFDVRTQNGECDEYYTLKNKAWALKIIINSYYGITGNKYYRFSNVNVAEAVTLTGQYLLKSVGDILNKKLNSMFGEKNRFIYGDTDSVYICLDDFVKDYESKKKKFDNSKQKAQFILDVSEKIIRPLIEKTIADITSYTNCFKNSLVMKREKICEKALFIQKKKYLLYIKNDDEFLLDEPKLTVKGVEIVRTSTPQVIRSTLKEFVKFIFETNDRDKLMQKLSEYRKQYDNYSIEQIAFPRGISDIEKHANNVYNEDDDFFVNNIAYKSTKNKKRGGETGTPIHVRGALIYNQLITKYKLEKKYPYIKSGEKIKFAYLKIPNPIRENVIAFPQGYKLPEEFKLHGYIDWNLQYEKSFIAPLEIILNVLNWNIKNTLAIELF